jgi:hypothetical protein
VETLPGSPEPLRNLLSNEAVRLAAGATGGRAEWFLWGAGSGQALMPLLPSLELSAESIAVSLPGRTIELDARLGEETIALWSSLPMTNKDIELSVVPLARRLTELRERIKDSGAPLLTWDEIDRELEERRGELR